VYSHHERTANAARKPGFFARLLGRGGGGIARHQLPFTEPGLDAVAAAGDLVYFDQRSGGRRRLVAVDPPSGQLRFDSGELPEEPATMTTANLQCHGDLAGFVTAPDGDDNACELRAVRAGTSSWSLPVGAWQAHFFIAGGALLAVYSHGQRTLLVRTDDGEVVARYPLEG
jgi:hypothetical protein